MDIQVVKACMARGGTMVLVHCERLYESLYDLLNQHYTECAGKLSVRLAIGAHSQLCPLDPKFRWVRLVGFAPYGQWCLHAHRYAPLVLRSHSLHPSLRLPRAQKYLPRRQDRGCRWKI